MAAIGGSNEIMAQVIDKVDKVLFANGFEFGDDQSWENAVDELSAWIFKYYEDIAGEGDFEPPTVSSTSDDDDDLQEMSTSEELSDAETYQRDL